MFTTTGSAGMSSTSVCATCLATAAALSQCCVAIDSSQPWPSTPKPVTAWLIAIPEMWPLRPVSAAPTVPE